MADDPRAIARRLPGVADVTGLWAIAERRLAAGDATFVTDLGIALWQRYGNEPEPPWQYRSLFDHVLRLLALTPGPVEHALRLISVAVDRRQVRYAASLLASAHSAAELRAVFDGPAPEELRACVLHEMVLRGDDVTHRWTESPHWRFHPLAWLPRSLTPLEGRPGLPHHTVRGGSHDLPTTATTPAPGHGPVPSAHETTTEATAAALGAAVANWAEESNGRIEARTWALDTPPHPDAVGDTLLALGLASLRDATARPGRCSATQAWQALFTAASSGGAYNSGAFGAYGRLLAWRSVAALVAAPPDAPAAEVEELAHSADWYSFAAASGWFEQVAWDIGLAAVSPDGRGLAVLAATDTD
ncbi:DUF6183 family protein [Asanoa sp. WMMD1127]|uniref:DUF6183 family protein n=1 Tax=Asanoa sp. WMMD1127 TaxID=3016107 RepID=UPI002416C2CD|nr:DUF6183 family protein [Asanoa sp. WMMD1127]MDG4826945.1 DUF6183 family protein [Asanoa sp. WMMD1127]